MGGDEEQEGLSGLSPRSSRRQPLALYDQDLSSLGSEPGGAAGAARRGPGRPAGSKDKKKRVRRRNRDAATGAAAAAEDGQVALAARGA